MKLDKLVWYDDYISGIEIIDKQHKDIFCAFNHFYDSVNSCELNQLVIKELIDALDFYTTVHFETEERYMLRYSYSEHESHKDRHDFFKGIYKEIKENKFFRYSKGHTFALQLAVVSSEWWGVHITTYDKELTAFLKSINTKG
jgi:hemerythrin